jgi:hypothetical protein
LLKHTSNDNPAARQGFLMGKVRLVNYFANQVIVNPNLWPTGTTTGIILAGTKKRERRISYKKWQLFLSELRLAHPAPILMNQ